MRRIAISLLVVFAACLAPLATAQDKDVNVGWVYFMAPKPGMTKQFEEGRKRHMDWHRKQNDTWRWETWEIMTGEDTGNYLSTTFGHSWQDLDAWEQKLGAADSADGAANLAPYLASTTASIWMLMKEPSHMAMENEPPKMAEANHFLLKPGTESDFNDAIKKINDAIVKSNWPVHYTWYGLQDGGEGPHYVLLFPMKGWADLAAPTPSFMDMLEKAVGRHDAEALTHALNKCIRREWTAIIKYRPDLSYEPAK
jgi:hypothetical protein